METRLGGFSVSGAAQGSDEEKARERMPRAFNRKPVPYGDLGEKYEEGNNTPKPALRVDGSGFCVQKKRYTRLHVAVPSQK
jgi:hypothetical protein